MIERLGPGDERLLEEAVALFKQAPADSTHLSDRDNVVLVARTAGGVVGWAHGYTLDRVTGSSMLLLYEVDVVAESRRLGIGTELVRQMALVAIDRGCSSMWVLTAVDDAIAHSLYAAAGGERVGDQAMFAWRFDGAGA